MYLVQTNKKIANFVLFWNDFLWEKYKDKAFKTILSISSMGSLIRNKGAFLSIDDIILDISVFISILVDSALNLSIILFVEALPESAIQFVS